MIHTSWYITRTKPCLNCSFETSCFFAPLAFLFGLVCPFRPRRFTSHMEVTNCSKLPPTRYQEPCKRPIWAPNGRALASSWIKTPEMHPTTLFSVFRVSTFLCICLTFGTPKTSQLFPGDFLRSSFEFWIPRFQNPELALNLKGKMAGSERVREMFSSL